MKKYTVKMGCGHESTVSLSGTQKECEDTIAYLERCGLCPYFFITPSTKNPKNVVK